MLYRLVGIFFVGERLQTYQDTLQYVTYFILADANTTIRYGQRKNNYTISPWATFYSKSPRICFIPRISVCTVYGSEHRLNHWLTFEKSPFMTVPRHSKPYMKTKLRMYIWGSPAIVRSDYTRFFKKTTRMIFTYIIPISEHVCKRCSPQSD